MISLIHPSRGRPAKSFENSRKWVQLSGVDTELIVAIDLDDPTAPEYVQQYNWWRHRDFQRVALVKGEHGSPVKATNMAAKEARGDILLYLSDDFECFENWGKIVEQEFVQYKDRQALIKVDDMLQPFHVAVLTIPIMNRQLYNKLGYFWHPGYKSMFVDEHLYWRSKALGALFFAPHIKFEHRHVSVGKAADDDTYRNSAANWNQGKAMFESHKRAGFVV